MRGRITGAVLTVWLGLLGANAPSAAQEPPLDKTMAPSVDKLRRREDEEIHDQVKKALKPVETERDKFIKTVQKLSARGVPDRPGSEFDVLFDRLSDGGDVWVLDRTPKGTSDLFERAASRLGLTTGRISRVEFHRYAAEWLREGRSPPWKVDDPQKRADKTFLKLDWDGDGVLGPDEMTPSLHADRGRFDRNGDGKIDATEYRPYFQARTQWEIDQAPPPRSPDAPPSRKESPPPPPPARLESVPTRSTPPREIPAERPASDLPGWFFDLDTDRDGQVGLYEWKAADLGASTFVPLDRNGDGLLTAEEMRSHLRSLAESPSLRAALDAAARGLSRQSDKSSQKK